MDELATVARPYTKALYSISAAGGKTESWSRMLGLLAALTEDSKVKLLINSPRTDKKVLADTLLTLIGKENLDPELVSLLRLLSENKRLLLLPIICKQFQIAILEDKQITPATIYSAYPLAAAELASLVNKIEHRCQVKLAAKLIIKPELIGGFKAEFRDQVLDMSVAGELAGLYNTIIN